MANIVGHMRPHSENGLGDLMPGWYSVPQNPVDLSREGIQVTPRIGDLLLGKAMFTVPQNPVKDFATGQVKMLGTQNGPGGVGCACNGTINGMSLGDLTSDWAGIKGDFSASNYTKILTDTVFGIPVWGVLLGGFVLMKMGGGTSGRRR